MLVIQDLITKQCVPGAYMAFRDADFSLGGRDCQCVRSGEERKDGEEDGRLHGCEGLLISGSVGECVSGLRVEEDCVIDLKVEEDWKGDRIYIHAFKRRRRMSNMPLEYLATHNRITGLNCGRFKWTHKHGLVLKQDFEDAQASLTIRYDWPLTSPMELLRNRPTFRE